MRWYPMPGAVAAAHMQKHNTYPDTVTDLVAHAEYGYLLTSGLLRHWTERELADRWHWTRGKVRRLAAFYATETARDPKSNQDRTRIEPELDQTMGGVADQNRTSAPRQNANLRAEPDPKPDTDRIQIEHGSNPNRRAPRAQVMPARSDPTPQVPNNTLQGTGEQELPPTPLQGDTADAGQVDEFSAEPVRSLDEINRIADQQAAALREHTPLVASASGIPTMTTKASPTSNSRAGKGRKGAEGPEVEPPEKAVKPEIAERFKSCALARALAGLWYGTECVLKDGPNADVFGALGDAALAWIESSGQAFVMDRRGYNAVRETFVTWIEQGQDPARLIDVATAAPTDDDVKGGWYTFVNRFRSVDAVQRTLARRRLPHQRPSPAHGPNGRVTNRYGGQETEVDVAEIARQAMEARYGRT